MKDVLERDLQGKASKMATIVSVVGFWIQAFGQILRESARWYYGIFTNKPRWSRRRWLLTVLGITGILVAQVAAYVLALRLF